MTDNKIKPKQYSTLPSMTQSAKKAIKALALGSLAVGTSGAVALGKSQAKAASWDGASSHGRALKQITVASPTSPAPTPPTPVSPPPAPTQNTTPRVVFPVSVNGTRLQYASGDTARLYGVNVSPNDAGGVAPRNTSTTEQVWQAAVNQGANFLVANIFEDLSMAQNGSKLDFVSNLSGFAHSYLPGTLVAWAPLTKDATDSRGAPTDATVQILGTIAQDLYGVPNVAIAVGSQYARSPADYSNNVGNHEINTQLIAQTTKAYNAIRAVNPGILVLVPTLIDETSGAQYSRSGQAWVNNTGTFSNVAYMSNLYTTASTDAGQMQQVQDWVGKYANKLPMVVTQIAPGQSTASQTNMSQTVFADTMNQLLANNTPVAMWNWEYQMAPSAQNAPITDASHLNLTGWGYQMVNTLHNASAGLTITPQG